MKRHDILLALIILCLSPSVIRSQDGELSGPIPAPDMPLESVLEFAKSMFTDAASKTAKSPVNNLKFEDYFVASAVWSPVGSSSWVDTGFVEKHGGKLPFWEVVLLANEGIKDSSVTPPMVVMLLRKEERTPQVFIFHKDKKEYDLARRRFQTGG